MESQSVDQQWTQSSHKQQESVMANIIFQSIVSGHTTVIPVPEDDILSGKHVYDLVSEREVSRLL